MPRRTATIFTVLAILAGLFLSTANASAGQTKLTPATANTAEMEFVDALNARRANHGLAPLVVDATMTAAARQWTNEMADGQFLAHADDITAGAPAAWTKAGENVGRGGDIPGLVQAFMDSPGHRANVLDPAYTRIGVGVGHDSTGMLYTTHRFAAVKDAKTLTCMGQKVTIVAKAGKTTKGTKGDDVILGTPGNDKIRGRGGNDIICGLGGDDMIAGGKGHDIIDAGTGTDVVKGKKGRDVIDGGLGADVLQGGAGNDTCEATSADRTVSCDKN